MTNRIDSNYHQNKNYFQEEDVCLQNDVFQLHISALSGNKTALRRLLENIEPSDLEVKDRFGRTPLIYSIMGNRVECATILLKSGSRVDNSDNCGQTALHWAAHKGLRRCVRLLLDNGALWHQKDIDGVTPLHLAARAISSKCLELICKEVQPGQLDIEDSSKKTPLHWSAAFGNAKHIKILLKKGANICIPDIEGKTPLHLAASCSEPGAVECVKILVENAPSVIDWQDYEGRSALHVAVAWGSTDIVDHLTSTERCNFNCLDNMFCTPLHWAASLGLADKVSLLLDRGAEFDSMDRNGATPLHYAAQGNYAHTVSIFLSRSYTCDKGDSEGRYALIWAAAKGADDVIQTMHTFNVDLSVSDKNGATALHAAASQGNISTIDGLLDFGAPLEACDKTKMTPFLYACVKGKAKSVRLLIEKGASLTAMDTDGRTSLHWATLGGHAYVCQILLQNDCNPNSHDFYGRTPLHCACHQGNINCTSVLLANGSVPNMSDNEGKTPLHIACLKGCIDAVRLLCEYGSHVNTMTAIDERYTPLDYALARAHTDIVQLLRELGALTSLEIKTIAAAVIQAFFKGVLIRKLIAKKKFFSCLASRKIENFTSSHSTTGKAYSTRNSYGSSDSEFQQSFNLQSSTSSFSKSIENNRKSRIPIAVWRTRRLSDNSLYFYLGEHFELTKRCKNTNQVEKRCVTHCYHCCICHFNLCEACCGNHCNLPVLPTKYEMINHLTSRQISNGKSVEIIQDAAAYTIQRAWKRYRRHIKRN